VALVWFGESCASLSRGRSRRGAESGAFGRADVRGGVHRRLLIQPGPPWGQAPEPSAAWTFVAVLILRILPMDGGIVPGSAAGGAGVADGTNAGAFGRADVRGGVHRRLLVQPGPELPWGQIPGPSLARTFVVVCIIASGSAGAGAAVGADPGAFARPDVRGGVHRRLWFSRGRSPRGDTSRGLRPRGRSWWCASLPPVQPGPEWPTGQIPVPSTARTWVVVFISRLPWNGWCGTVQAQPPPGPEWPMGQSPEPSPAWTWVGMCIGRFLVGGCGLVAARRRASGSRLAPSVERGVPPGGDGFGTEAPREGRVMRGGGTNRSWGLGRRRAPARRLRRSWPSQPLSSMRTPAAARTMVRTRMVLPFGQPLGSMPRPLPARTCVVVFIGAPVSSPRG